MKRSSTWLRALGCASVLGLACMGGARLDQEVDGLITYLGTASNASSKGTSLEFRDRAVPGLRRAAMVGTSAERVEAIRLLAKLGSDKDYEFLVNLITDSEAAVRQPASAAIDEIYEREQSDLMKMMDGIVPHHFSKEERATVDLVFQTYRGGAKGKSIRDAIDLMSWRVPILNYVKSPSPKAGERVLQLLIPNSWKDGPMDPKQLPNNHCGGPYPGDADWTRAFTYLWKKSPTIISDHLSDQTFKYRGILVWAYSQQPPLALRPLLLQLASDPVDSVRNEACKSLFAFKDDEVSERLVELAHDKIAMIRIDALQSLQVVDPLAALDEALRLLRENGMRSLALSAVSYADNDIRCLVRLSELLSSRDRELAKAACFGIGSIRDPRAVATLNAIIQSGPADLRAAATSCFQRYDVDLVHSILVKCLGDNDDRVVVNACQVLRELKDIGALGNLKLLHNHKSPAVREAVTEAVAGLAADDRPPPP